MNGNIITVEHLSHAYGDLQAVRNISFTVKKGEIFSFLGPNGAGKSTAISVLITLLSLQQGTVTIAGYDLKENPNGIRRSIGIVFQEITLDRDMNVRETLEFHGRLYNIPHDERKKRTQNLLELVELEDKADVLTRHLSGGMKRRLEIARGLMTRPEVLFLDEPTIGLDPQTRMRVWEYLEEVNRAGTTIFLTTHYMDEADHLSDKIAIIDHGKIIVTGTPDTLKNTLGEDLVVITSDQNERAAEILSVMDGVKEVTIRNDELLIMVTGDGSVHLPVFMQELSRHEIQINSVNLKKPSMDDVFLHYTGRGLRSEETDNGTKEPKRRG